MTDSFDTERLRVFTQNLTISEYFGCHRTLYTGFPTTDEHCHTPMPLATALVSRVTPTMTYLDWIEVASEYRRHGFATELLQAVMIRHPDLRMGGATDAGTAFLDSILKDPAP